MTQNLDIKFYRLRDHQKYWTQFCMRFKEKFKSAIKEWVDIAVCTEENGRLRAECSVFKEGSVI